MIIRHTTTRITSPKLISPPQSCLICQFTIIPFQSLNFQRNYSSSSPSVPPKLGQNNTPKNPTNSTQKTYETIIRPRVIKNIKEDIETVEIPPLNRPIGQYAIPKPGENHGKDLRTRAQKKRDFQDYDKHLEKRRQLQDEFKKSYFQDFSDMKHSHGKLFISPPRIFKSDKSLFFPNFRGRTLESPDIIDTTTLFKDRVSLVTISSSVWAERQLKTFTKDFDDGKFKDSEVLSKSYISEPDDHVKRLMLEEQTNEGIWQRVDVNLQTNWLKALILWMSMRNIRRSLDKERHARYMIVKKGVTGDMEKSIGMLNERIGYVYLIDAFCRIRWAGCAGASDDERLALKNGLERLVAEEKNRRESLVKGEKAE